MTPSWGGQAYGGADAMWSQDAIGAMGPHATTGGNRLDADLGYGLPLSARFVGTPSVGFGNSECGRRYRTGYRVQMLEKARVGLQLCVDAERVDGPSFGKPERSGADKRVIAHATVQWE